jgi:hypothetical protein
VLGVSIADSLESVEKRLHLLSDVGDPWSKPRIKPFLGHLLKPEDLQLPEGGLGRLAIRWTDGERATVVLFHEGKAVALVTSDRDAVTRRGVRIRDSFSRAYTLYDEGGRSNDVALPGGGHVDVRRYDRLGIGFEIQHRQVSTIVLYRPAK